MSKRYYVTMTWDDWPDGGSYGTVVRASDHEHAEELCREKMARVRTEGIDTFDPESKIKWWLENYGSEWHLVDCFDLDEFVARNLPAADEEEDET